MKTKLFKGKQELPAKEVRSPETSEVAKTSVKLITTLTIGLVLFLFILPFTLAINATTATYSVGSEHQGSSGENASSTTYSSRSTTTFQQGGNDNGTTTTYNFNLGWFGTTASAAEDSPTPQGATGGAGGGGSQSLNWLRSLFTDEDEDCESESEWECGPWSECENGQQRRYCSDINNCNEPTDEPETIQDCGTGSSGDDDDDDTTVDSEEYGTDTYSGTETDGIILGAEGNPIDSNTLTTEKSKKSSILKTILIILGIGLVLGIAYYILKKAMKKSKSF
jgi:hypothetical protein